ncbi:conserved hypothetical protein [Haloferula helveola]|uniref:DUF4870 domain-containing protein n=1 Tax=Haloferula helveola TaxID=490095 RepID=A0ABM7RH51_9BACT|nr:conserved hypothetical protein [Haloferula helveola]
MIDQPPPMLPANPVAPPVPTEEERTLGMLCHLLGLLTGFIGPLILWLVKKDESAYINHHGKEALNFQLSELLYFFVLGSITFVLMFFFIGLLLLPVLFVLWVLAVVASVLGCTAANRGEWFRYPGSIRFIP